VREIQAPALPDEYVEFSYRRELRALIGTWQGKVLLPAGSPPELGGSWTVPGIMENGLVSRADKLGDSEDGRVLWSLSGYDAGFRLMKSPMLPHQIKGSSLGDVLSELAEGCGLKADVTLDRDVPVDARHLVSGQTAANAVLDLATLGGAVAYMVQDGTLKIAPPRPCKTYPCKGLNLDDVQARDLDLDGYASGVVVILGRRGDSSGSVDEDEDGPGGGYYGTTPSGSLKRVSKRGTTSLPGGTLSWSYTLLSPINVVESYEATLFLPGAGIRKSIVSNYSYDVESSVVRVGDQEQRLWRFCLVEAGSVEDTAVDAVYYDHATGGLATETVEHVMEYQVRRSYDMDKTHILKEVVEINSYDPDRRRNDVPYTHKTERAWTWDDDHGYRGLTEREWSYEERDVGEADLVTGSDGNPLTWVGSDGQTRYIQLPAYQTTTMIKRERQRQIDEVFDDDGKCVTRIERTTDDNGLADMLERGLFGDLYDPANSRAGEALAQMKTLLQDGSMRIIQVPGGSSISEEVGTLSQPGRRYRKKTSGEDGGNRYIDGIWSEETCPFLCSDGTCGVVESPSAVSAPESSRQRATGWDGSGVETVDGPVHSTESSESDSEDYIEGDPCGYLDNGKTPGYERCSRYKAFRHLAGSTSGTSPVSPVVGMSGGGSIWTEKELYIDEHLSEDRARSIAQTIADNILSVKKVSRGIVETVTVPLDMRVHPDGGVMAVEHSFDKLRTSISFRPSDTTPPEYLMLLNSGSTAANVYARESIGKGRSAFGRVVDVRPDRALVILGGRPVSCTSSIRIKRGDNALVFLPPGSVSSGVIQAVMK